MKRTRTFTVVFAAMFPVLALAATNGCGNKKDDDTTPTASAPPPPPPPPATASAVVMPEEPDAGADAGDAGDAAPKTGGGGSYTSISKCCAALRGNAKSAPPEQVPGYMAAAQACEGLKNTPAANVAFAQIRSFLMGAKMPAACQ